MGRRRTKLVSASVAAGVVVAFGINLAQAQPPGPQGPPRRIIVPRRMPEPRAMRDRWMALPPEDRQVFRQNAERWMQMSPEERVLMREREKAYRARIKTEVDATLRNSGLRLEGEKRDQFERRYLQERRHIEQLLRREIDTKRQQELPALQERLKKEFQEPSSPGTTSPSTPAAGGSPKK